MKRHAVTVPIPGIAVRTTIMGVITGLILVDGAAPGWVRGVIALASFISSVWSGYSTYRELFCDSRPLTVTFGKAPVEIAPVEPEQRQPLAFPPQENQCFVCGNYDQHRQDVFGDASHATCREWLGDWKAPRWLISYEERYSRVGYHTGSGHLAYVQRPGFYNNNVADLSGFQTRQQVIDYCHEKLKGDLDKGLTAEMKLSDGQTIRFKIPVLEKPVPEPVPGNPSEPIDPETARAFYNNEGMSITDFLKGY